MPTERLKTQFDIRTRSSGLTFSISQRSVCRAGGCVKNHGTLGLRSSAVTTAAFILLSMFNLSMSSLAQESAPAAASQSGDAALHDLVSQQLASQVRELRAAIEQMRTENAQSRAEMQELRQELQETRKLLAPLVASTNSSPSSSAATESATDSG